MVSPIQNLIGISAAGATPVVFANSTARTGAISSQINNPAIQQIIATQASQVITQAGKQRITDDREVVDPSFDSEEKEAKAENSSEDEKPPVKRKHDGTLDVVA
jgi:hypothetical protein